LIGALQPTRHPATVFDALRVARAGGVDWLVPHVDGAIAKVSTLTLPPERKVISLEGFDPLYVLDSATQRVEVFAGTAGGTSLPAAELAVGPGANALTTVDLPPSDPATPLGAALAVTDSDADDVTVYSARGDEPFGAPRRIRVGRAPSAILTYAPPPGQVSAAEGLAVANTGSASVSLLTGDNAGGFVPEATVPVAGRPVSLALTHPAFDGGDSGDLLVGGAGPGALTVLGLFDSGHAARRYPLLSPVSRPIGLASGDFNGDLNADVAVADAGTGTVQILYGRADGSFGAPAVIRRDLEPVAITAGSYGGDYRDDVAVADARSRSVLLLLSPGDRLVTRGEGLSNIDGRGAQLAWSRRTGPHVFRLVVNGADVAVAPSRRPLVPHIGRSIDGHPTVAYVRCRGDRCRPQVWDIGRARERALHIRVGLGCQIVEVATFARRRAYAVARMPGRRCLRAARGIWLQDGKRSPRRLASHGLLGQLTARTFTWQRLTHHGDESQNELLTPGPRIRTLATGDFDCCSLTVPHVDGRFAYWATQSRQGVTLTRARIDRRRLCPSDWPSEDPRTAPVIPVGLPAHDGFLGDAPDFTAAQSRLFYLDPTGAFQVDPQRVHWRRRCP
jgi:hypothetical protein